MPETLNDLQYKSFSTGFPAVPFLARKVEKEITFVAGTTGAVATATLFNVTGLVDVTLIAVCSVSVTSSGAGTLAVGTAITAGGLIASTTASNIVANEIWYDTTPDASIELDTVSTRKLVSQNISYTVGTATLTSGVVKFILTWSPVSANGDVTVA